MYKLSYLFCNCCGQLMMQVYNFIHIYMYIYMYICKLNHFVIHLKLTQHCKSTILQWKKFKGVKRYTNWEKSTQSLVPVLRRRTAHTDQAGMKILLTQIIEGSRGRRAAFSSRWEMAWESKERRLPVFLLWLVWGQGDSFHAHVLG